jgi:hypothetical protein
MHPAIGCPDLKRPLTSDDGRGRDGRAATYQLMRADSS